LKRKHQAVKIWGWYYSQPLFWRFYE